MKKTIRMSNSLKAIIVGTIGALVLIVAGFTFYYAMPMKTIELSNELITTVIDEGIAKLEVEQLEKVNFSRKYSAFLDSEIEEQIDISIGSLNEAYARWQTICAENTDVDYSRNYKPIIVNGVVFLAAEDCDIMELKAEDFPCASEFNRYMELIYNYESPLPFASKAVHH